MPLAGWPRPLIFALVLAALGASLCVTARGGNPDRDAAAFAKGLARVRALEERGKGKRGLKVLQELLSQHKGRDYARALRAPIDELASRMVFRTQYPAPGPRDVLEGELLDWVPSTSQIKMRYTFETRHGLERRGRFWMFTGRFSGPCKIEIKGRQYPSGGRVGLRVLFGGDTAPTSGRKQSWEIDFGLHYLVKKGPVWDRNSGRGRYKAPATITHIDGESESWAAHKDVTTAKSGRRYTVSVSVTQSRMSAKINGRTLMSAKKPRDVFGEFGFDVSSWSEMTVSGKIEPSWLQSKIDEVSQSQRKEFRKTYDRTKVLPSWLFGESNDRDLDLKEGQGDLPVDLGHRHWPDLALVRRELGRQSIEAALEAIARLAKADAPESTCAFLEARVYAESGRPARALAAAQRCTELAPEFLRSRLLTGTLLRRLGRQEASIRVFLAATQLHPDVAEAYETATLSALYAGSPADARRFTQAAAKRGISSRQLEALASALAKAVNGPVWARTNEHRSSNYHVLSDLDEKTCLEASKLLEEAFTAYRVNFGWVSRDTTRLFRVYLFSGAAGFRGYIEELEGLLGGVSDRTAGIYSPLLKQLLIWNLPRRAQMMEVIRHEGFHQYLDRLLPEAPVWLDEGLAEYHENAARKAGRLKFGQLHTGHLRLLRRRGLLPLAAFLSTGRRQFYKVGLHSYAQAWALIHMFHHGDVRHRKLFRKLVKDLQEDRSTDEVIKGALTDDVLKDLDVALSAYVADLGS